MGLGLAALLALFAPVLAAEAPPAARPVPDEGRYIGRSVPDVVLTDARGQRVALSELWRDRPLLLALVFSRCVGVCSPFLASLRSAEAALHAPDARTVVVSFDARDTPADMAAWAGRLGLSDRPDWTFAVAAPAEVAPLVTAVGFWSAWDEDRQQFDHPALLAAVAHGRVVRLLVGGDVAPVRLQEVVRELQGELVASYPLPGTVLARCFQYDPARGRFVLGGGFFLLMLPAGLAAFGTLSLFALARRHRAGGGPA